MDMSCNTVFWAAVPCTSTELHVSVNNTRTCLHCRYPQLSVVGQGGSNVTQAVGEGKGGRGAYLIAAPRVAAKA